MRKHLIAKLTTAVIAIASIGNAVVATVTLPPTGVDVGAHVTAAGTDLGAIVVVIVGVFFAFMLVRFGIRWAKRMGG